MKIIQAQAEHLAQIRALFREYQTWLDADVCFQNFEEELSSLPGDYSQPYGAIYLALVDNQAVACSAIKPSAVQAKTHAELKRLYVQETHRGEGLGREIFNVSMQAAKAMEYESVILETLPDKMKAAQFLYRDYGFKPMENYLDNADQGVECFQYHFKDHVE